MKYDITHFKAKFGSTLWYFNLKHLVSIREIKDWMIDKVIDPPICDEPI